MKIKAKRDLTHAGKPRKVGDIFDAPDHDANQLIQSGHAEKHDEGDAAQQPTEKK